VKYLLLLTLFFSLAQAQQAQKSSSSDQAALRKELETVYETWRNSMIQKDAQAWAKITATHRQMTVRNRLNSERRAFPQAVFNVPAAPPALAGLRAVQIEEKGLTAKCIYFGKIDFAVGGNPTENLITIDFVKEKSGWKYDIAEFVSLVALPEVRAELAKGDLSYIQKTTAFRPTGIVPPTPAAVPLAKYIGKVYIFCPGRSANVTVNNISPHSLGNAKDAQLILGGLRDGENTISYELKDLPGASQNEALCLRVYVFSQFEGVKPIKLFEYQVEEGKNATLKGSHTFTLSAATAKTILGK
jgi:hypothetical protein